MPGEKNGLVLHTQKMYIKTTSQCMILYQYIVGEFYTIISEGKFTQSMRADLVDLWDDSHYNANNMG